MKGIDTIIDRFIKMKGDLFPFFNKDLRIEIKVDSTSEPLTKTDIQMVFNNWYSGKGEKLFLKNQLYSENLINYQGILMWIHYYIDKFSIEELLNGYIENLKLNPLTNEYFPRGTKISKYILTLIDYEYKNNPYFLNNSIAKIDIVKRLVLDYYSQILSSFKNVKGTVVLSINPIDFMLVSAHTKGDWRSCHNYLDGRYKTAGISYALDKYTAVVYAYEEKTEYNIENFSEILPLKLWRQMVYLDRKNRSAVFAKEYPGPNPLYSKFSRKIIAKLYSEMFNINPAWLVTAYDNNETSTLYNEEKETDENIVSIHKNSNWHYQDAIISRIRMKDEGKYRNNFLPIGSETLICPICGKERDDEKPCYVCENCYKNL
jgi:hypothetical protein